ncbi:MAG: transporter [Ferruginibacter sp.]
MRKFFFLLFIAVLTCIRLLAQENEFIDADRPDQSDGTNVIEKKQLQVETGCQFARLDEFTCSFDNTSLIRYGICKGFEARLLNQYSVIKNTGCLAGWKPLTLSFKNFICKPNHLLPELTIVSYFQLPFTISKDFPGEHIGYSFILATNNDLKHGFEICSNFGIVRDQESTDISYPASLELNYSFTKKLSAFLEYFGSYAPHASASNGMDLGVEYAFKKNYALDLAIGSSTFKPSSNRFITFGISARLPH